MSRSSRRSDSQSHGATGARSWRRERPQLGLDQVRFGSVSLQFAHTCDKLAGAMLWSRKENLVTWVILLPLGLTVNALLLWGFRDQINLKDPLSWIFMVAWLAAILRIGRTAKRRAGLAR